jgi:hypothetical protein
MDKLLKWGYKSDVQCAFCRSGIEVRDHLFFLLSLVVIAVEWKRTMKMCNIVYPPTKWDDIIYLGLQQYGGRSSLYNFWRNINFNMEEIR